MPHMTIDAAHYTYLLLACCLNAIHLAAFGFLTQLPKAARCIAFKQHPVAHDVTRHDIRHDMIRPDITDDKT